MTNRTIEAVTFDTWRGVFQSPSITISTFIRAGVSGVGATKQASQPQRIEINATYIDDLSTCQSTQTTIEGWRGTFVDATDDLGNGYNHTLVESVTTAIMPIIGDADYMLTVTLVLWPDETT